MGTKDSKAKEYFADNERFADFCNYVLYGGRCVIKAENLEERDTTEVLTALGLSLNMISVQKWRDIFKISMLNIRERHISFLWGWKINQIFIMLCLSKT